jgi:hypothetical protein
LSSGRLLGTIPQIHVPDQQPPALGPVSSQDLRTSADHIAAALEATCETLITLQLLSMAELAIAAGANDVQAQLLQASESLRRAIAELRMLRDDQPGVLTMGFVVESKRGFRRRPRRERSLKPPPNRIDRGLDPA